ncbi:sigma-70 family RNA polymerase sigma factor [Agromyces binzhouensis]|uniref:Sigma-70 family RNA polymerase sigma factor n=1 Tax=Agromyces binzhouensis TaxID=1817495 RepID=A0A4Q2JU31_9MICO|nr:sigma-70 family RNA polymerase sigma factor [Agromyces binzhouensis]RXZ51931.1 sigma-70 family RNA polymerase sigma factor [Agromyces binzhouensis]
MTVEREPTAAEMEEWQREHTIASSDEITDVTYPRMTNLSAGFMFRAIAKPLQPERPEYVTIRSDGSLETVGMIAQWNLPWEAGQFRRRYFDEDDFTPQLRRIASLGDVNVTLVPRTRSRYWEYAPLVHLLPRATLERFGLPLLRAGQWPFLADSGGIDRYLPEDFEQRLSRAWASVVWPHLVSGSPMRGFSKDDPIRLLSHNLDYWLPPVTAVIQDTLRQLPEIANGIEPGPVTLVDGSTLEGAIAANPRKGGDIWEGEQEAAEIVERTVEAADGTGRLRGILDAVRSNRVEDDFSSTWSFAREDFERKLYRKRSKTRVRFVELTDTIPVQAPESDILGSLVTNDFLAVLDQRNRQIVVLLNSGYTTKTEIAEILGFANHSPVSKRLAQIRKTANDFFGED